jgi:hypothetical protein
MTGPLRPCSRRPDGRRGLLAYVEQALVPEFRPHDIVIMDTCRQAIEAAASLPLTVPTSARKNAPTVSRPQVTMQRQRKML